MSATAILQDMHERQQADIARLALDQRATYSLVRKYVRHESALAIAVLKLGQEVLRSGYPGTVRVLHLTGDLAGMVEVRLGSGEVIVPAVELKVVAA